MMRGFRDRDFIITPEGFFFCVIGPSHPPRRVISYIKYVPSKSGFWRKGRKKYDRKLKNYTIPSLIETIDFLEKEYPYYLFNSSINNITVTAVPIERIKNHFKPEQKLAHLKSAPKLDSLQRKLINFIELLNKLSNISEESFGVTGSLLLDIHQPRFSDLDIIVYGIDESWALKKTLTNEDSSEIPITRLKGSILENWCLRKTQQHPLTTKEAFEIYKRKWNLGLFKDTWVSIHPVKFENEVVEKFGLKSYVPFGQVTIQAKVIENFDSLFLPSSYKIEDVKFLEGKQPVHIGEVVSYEGLYASLAEKGETIQVRGKLEKIQEKGTRKQDYRVLVGSLEGHGTEYIKIMK